MRLEAGADLAAVTTAQLRNMVAHLIAGGEWKPGDLQVLMMMDAGYDAPWIAQLLTELPMQVLGRLHSDRVMRRSAPRGVRRSPSGRGR